MSYTVGQDCRWRRDSTVLSSQQWTNYFNRNTNPIADYYPTLNWHYVDTPNTTSQITYKLAGATEGAATWRINNNGTNNKTATWSASFSTSITVMEIAA